MNKVNEFNEFNDFNEGKKAESKKSPVSRRFTEILGITAVFLVLFSCSSVPKENSDSFYSENIKDFSESTLSNGIPVFFKNTANSRITVLQMIIEGGTPLLTVEKSGLEGVTLELMMQGSQKFSFDEIKALEYEMTFSLGWNCSKDYSVVSLKCIENDFDTVFPLFCDSILSPLMEKEQFEKIMTERAQSVQASLSEPSSQIGRELHKIAYENHIYAPSSSVTEDSLDSITYEDVILWHEKILNAKRIKFVAVGNFDSAEQKRITSLLNENFGNISQKEFEIPLAEKITVRNETFFIANENAGETSYVAGIFDCPERYDEDYVPFAIASMFIDDVLFSYVREQKGAVYSVGTGVLSGKEMLGAVSAYRVSDRENIITYIEESFNNFPQIEEIEEKLEMYKNRYITTLFSSSQSTSGVASNMTVSLVYSSNPAKYLERNAEVRNVSAEDVLNAYKKYFPHADSENPVPVTWVTVGK